MLPSQRQSERFQQIPDFPSRIGHDAIFNGNYLIDIPDQLRSWGCKRVLLVYSKSLDKQTDKIINLVNKLDDAVVDKKAGVGSHSPYADVVDIAHRLHSTNADCLVCVGSSSYSDACKIAVFLNSTLPANFTAASMESLVDQKTGTTSTTALQQDSKVKLIVVPTSLSASEWNAVSSATNTQGKKQHFGTFDSKTAPDLIILDPEVASTTPEWLWLSSGVRAVDHCVETMCNLDSNDESDVAMARGLRLLLVGLKEYKQGRDNTDRQELLQGISECQRGSRDAMMGIIIWRIPMGGSHAIGHQLGSVGHVQHGITSAILLSPVLRFTKARNPGAQSRVTTIFNEVFGWNEMEAADAVARFVKMLGLPTTLREVGVKGDEIIELIAEKTKTDIWGGGKPQLDYDETMEILNMVR